MLFWVGDPARPVHMCRYVGQTDELQCWASVETEKSSPWLGTQVDRVSVTPQEGLMEFGLIEGKFSDFSKFRKSGKSLKHELG